MNLLRYLYDGLIPFSFYLFIINIHFIFSIKILLYILHILVYVQYSGMTTVLFKTWQKQ